METENKTINAADNRPPYKIIDSRVTGEYEEKKSRFIATLCPVKNEEEANAFIASMKKKYYDARHNCSCFILGDRSELTRSSDDGEPSGTAGKPMLEVLLGAQVTYVCCVVTRYFGGVLLGTGGLVRAYTEAVKDALSKAYENDGVKTVEFCKDIKAVVAYDQVNSILNYASKNKVTILSTEYLTEVTFLLRVRGGEYEKHCEALTQLTMGKAIIEKANEGFFPV